MDYHTIDNHTIANLSMVKPPNAINKPLFIGCLFAELVVGMIANASLIWLVGTVKELRNPPSILLTNQAIGDLCFLGFSMIPQLVSSLTPGYVLPSWLCYMNHFTYFTSFAVSALSLTAISIERYHAIVRPLKFRQVRRLRVTAGVCVVVWLLASSFGAYAVSATIYTSMFCTFPYERVSFRVYFLFQLVLLYVIPVLSMTVFYGICARHLLRKEVRCASGRSGNKGYKARVRVAINLMIITVVFTLCWLPQYVFFSWFLFGFDFVVFGRRSMILFKTIRTGLYYFASCINPIILYAMSSSFRHHFVQKVTCYAFSSRSKDYSLMSARTNASLRHQSSVCSYISKNRIFSPKSNTREYKPTPTKLSSVEMERLDKANNQKNTTQYHVLEDRV